MTKNLSKHAFEGPSAWDVAGTSRALWRWAGLRLARAVGWVALWWGAVYVTVAVLPAGAAVPMVVVLCALGVLAVLSFGRLWRGLRMRRILRVYPWRQESGAVLITDAGDAAFRLPDPDHPEKTVSLKVAAGLFRSWGGAALRDYDDELWYAGDPRFACVVAKPGPRGLACLAQPTAYDHRTSPRRKSLSPEARSRARAIGARVAD
ncbi:hypothetical protein [Streptomyces boluensis]|uniref:Uncharacterized protein n=1 Tax=Streptomyces boluensis TaxID=1775135 RepID=A0A964UVE1_9ACTN|nr:hypothetical protein [Streptomyces boluensis]NBE54913.1 hypothetical protein [Streptomyces boluensis]